MGIYKEIEQKKRNKLVSKIYKNEKKNISNLISNIMNFNNKETENRKYFRKIFPQ